MNKVPYAETIRNNAIKDYFKHSAYETSRAYANPFSSVTNGFEIDPALNLNRLNLNTRQENINKNNQLI